MKKAMELSILCGCEVGLIINFDQKIHVYASSTIENVIGQFHDYEGPYVALDNKHLTALTPGRASSYKVHHDMVKARQPPCEHCGSRQSSSQQLPSRPLTSSGHTVPTHRRTFSGEYKAPVNTANTYVAGAPGAKRRRVENKTQVPRKKNDVKMYSNPSGASFRPPAAGKPASTSQPFTPIPGSSPFGTSASMIYPPLINMGTGVLPSPSAFFKPGTPSALFKPGTPTGGVSMNMDPFGWQQNGPKTPVLKVPKVSNKLSGSSTSAAMEISLAGTAKKPQIKLESLGNGPKNTLSRRRELKLNNLDMSNVEKPSVHVVEVSNSNTLTAVPTSVPAVPSATTKPPRHEKKAPTPAQQTPGLGGIGSILTPSLGNMMAFSPLRTTGDFTFLTSPKTNALNQWGSQACKS
mmetsp:Transcript_37467/g.69036  ORF Transcript_37467/g.69036 Transcript_37467/m.69036 type:complete len:407 (+) Transcript_37467:264-1484(+)